MASRKHLKKNIRLVCEALFAETVSASLYSSKADDENISSILIAVVRMQSEYVNRISHVEPKMAPKIYFKDLIEKFNKQIDEIVDNLKNYV